MNETPQHPDDFANAFESAFAHLQVSVLDACARAAPWPAKVAAGVGASLEFAMTETAAARLLAIEAMIHRPDGAERYLRLIEHFADLLRAEAPHDARRPPSTEQALIGGLASMIAEYLRYERPARLREEAPELVEFILLPYLGPFSAPEHS